MGLSCHPYKHPWSLQCSCLFCVSLPKYSGNYHYITTRKVLHLDWVSLRTVLLRCWAQHTFTRDIRPKTSFSTYITFYKARDWSAVGWLMWLKKNIIYDNRQCTMWVTLSFSLPVYLQYTGSCREFVTFGVWRTNKICTNYGQLHSGLQCMQLVWCYPGSTARTSWKSPKQPNTHLGKSWS